MTQEEKAKAYDEAIEKAKQTLEALSAPEAKMIVYHFFPELCESEDERIRKWLYDYVFNCPNENFEFYGGVGKQAVLAWLEKQKEPHYTKQNALFDKCVENCVPEIMKKVSDEVDEMLQKEQKPTPDWMPKFLDELRAKKHYFDWDEHRDIEGHILAIINWIAPDYFDRKEKEQKPSIFPPGLGEVHFNPIPSAEKELIQPHTVSTKDAIKFGNLEYERGVKDGIQSEKSRQWKPSEEQMESLAYAIQVLNSNPHPRSAKAYQDLQTLYKNIKHEN